MSSHDQLELAQAYALGSLDEGERTAFESHLPTCAECRAAVAACAPAAGALGHAVSPVALPPGSADRLVALLRAEKATGLFPAQRSDPASGRGSAPVAPAPRSSGVLIPAALAIVALGMSAAAIQSNLALRSTADEIRTLEDESSKLRDSLGISEKVRHTKERELAKTRAELQHCQEHAEAIALFRDPRNIQVPLKAQPGFEGMAAVVAFDKESRKVAVANGALPPPPSGKTYKLWALVKGKAPQPLLAFDPNASDFHLDQIDRALGGDVQFAISLETNPNTLTPTSIALLPG